MRPQLAMHRAKERGRNRYELYDRRLRHEVQERSALEGALRRAMAVEDRPSLIVLRSHIGYPSPHLTDTKDWP